MANLHKKLNKTTKIAVFSGSLLVATLATCLYSPVFKTNAAEESADVNVNVNPIISLTLSTGTLSFDVTPTVEGSFNQKPLVATVDTNSTGGYELYFSSEDSATAMTSLTSTSTITSDFSGTVTSSTMANNKWGYSLNTTNFSKIPALADQAKIKDLDHFPTSNEKDTTVNIATKIDNSLPSGTYSKKVLFTAIAHPSLTPNLNKLVDLISMQDPKLSQYCADTYTPTKNATELDWERTFFGDLVPRASVQDSRDGKYYLISKLADGNCWMSQNLELMLDSTESLTDETTDLNTKTSWRPENSTFTEVPNTNVWPYRDNASASAAYSYYPIASDRYFRNGLAKNSSPTASGVEYDWEKAGSYYNWYAATAGSGTYEITSESVSDSICPRGWMLPSGTQDNKSWYYLLTTEYGVNAASVKDNPLNLIQAGYYSYYNGDIYNRISGGIRQSGYYWSSTAYTQKERAYVLSFNNPASINVQNWLDKGHGTSIRCVAR